MKKATIVAQGYISPACEVVEVEIGRAILEASPSLSVSVDDAEENEYGEY